MKIKIEICALLMRSPILLYDINTCTIHSNIRTVYNERTLRTKNEINHSSLFSSHIPRIATIEGKTFENDKTNPMNKESTNVPILQSTSDEAILNVLPVESRWWE